MRRTAQLFTEAADEIEQLKITAEAEIPCDRGTVLPPIALTPLALLEAIIHLQQDVLRPLVTVRLLHSEELAVIVSQILSPENASANMTAITSQIQVIPEIVSTAHAYDWHVVIGEDGQHVE